jgi:tRNA threonylcarbamoyl adenosine modification protein (Sua5/YciO/YrdC/YwlC family)
MNDTRFATEKKKESLRGRRQKNVTTQLFTSRDPDMIPAVTEAIQRGELVILPTDTVYGVGASVFDEEAIQRLFFVKQRSGEKGIPILLADESDLEKVAASVPPLARNLMTRFWPGPLTLVLPKRKDLPPSISETESVAVRMPDHEVGREIIRAAGGTLATTSANLSGNAPAKSAWEALRELAGAVAIVVDDGPSGGQMASTVVDCTGDRIRILRHGPVTMEALLEGESL